MKRGLTFSLCLMGALILLVMASPGASRAQQQEPTLIPTNTPRGTEAAPGETAVPPDAASPSPTITPTTIGPYEYPENTNPLTGLPYPDEEAKNRRNLIIKVSNFPEVVRPQYGLSAADIVFEYEVEGGVTRFAAIYRSQGAERVGSIRSARLMDIELVTIFKSLLGYSGSNEYVRNYILNSDWRWRALSPQIGNNCPMFCRIQEDNRAFEHTLFANTYAIWDEAERIGVNDGLAATGLAFDENPDPAPIGTASDIAIDWFSDRSETRWQYNAADGKYYRFDSGLPHIDAATGQQITADNVVVIEVWHSERPDIYESETGGIAIEHQFWGYAKTWVFRDGMWYEGEWYRNKDSSGLQLRYDRNDRDNPIHLKPGQTWFEVVRKFYPGNTNPLFSVTVSDDLVNAAATAEVVRERLTAIPAATQTQFAEWYGSPTPSATWTPTPTGTWQR